MTIGIYQSSEAQHRQLRLFRRHWVRHENKENFSGSLTYNKDSGSFKSNLTKTGKIFQILGILTYNYR